jgi:CBS domain containing-hemolysin-like protein
VEETERLIDRDLPHGPFSTVAGLVTDRLNRLARSGDVLILDLHDAVDEIDQGEGLAGDRDEVDAPEHRSGPAPRPRLLEITVMSVRRRVPSRLRLRWREPDAGAGR